MQIYEKIHVLVCHVNENIRKVISHKIVYTIESTSLISLPVIVSTL